MLSMVRLAWLLASAVSIFAADGVSKVPPELRERLQLSEFYQKFSSAKGLPVLSSARVSDYALLEARFLIDKMLEHRPDVREAMIRNKVRFVVMGVNEFTTAVPEHSTLEPAKFWDKRARGLGASPDRPVVSCGEENLLGYTGDPYLTENILIHEFAHAMHTMGLRTVDRTFDTRLRDAFAHAKEKGLWKGTYAMTDRGEYWAEAVQSWFDTNRENDAQHNHVNTREELVEYDPEVAALVREVYGDSPWRYKKPAERPASETTHLKGFDPANGPQFSWPKDLIEWNRQYAVRTAKPESELVTLQVHGPGFKDISDPVSTLRDTSILFLNHRDSAVTLYEVTTRGGKKEAGEIAAKQEKRRPAYAGQTLMLVDPKGETIGYIVATTPPSKVVLE